MSDLYVVGGAWRGSLFKKVEEWHAYKKAVIVKLNRQAKTSETVLEYVSPPDVCPEDRPSILFKAASVAGDKIYVCTQTEVLIYRLPDFKLLSYISLTCFNDLHHVTPTCEGNVLVAVTGLDMVVEVSPQGKMLREWSVIGEDTWQRFSREVDYRKVLQTKPHKSHPNYVFQLDDEIWVTRFEQRDAISLTNPGRRIDIRVQRPHDGHVVGDWIYFTTVDGHLVIANRNTLKTEEILDLNTIDNEEQLVLGWCRGVLPTQDDKDKVWVAFTRIRFTKFRENLLWAKHRFENPDKPTRIALYDLAKKRRLEEISLETHGLDVLFSMHDVIEPING